MFWNIVGALLLLFFGFLLIFETEQVKNISWAIRHGVDEEGERVQKNALRFLGVFVIVMTIFWMVDFLSL